MKSFLSYLVCRSYFIFKGFFQQLCLWSCFSFFVFPSLSFSSNLSNSLSSSNLLSVEETSPLSPIKLDNPRSTMGSYLKAMGDYKKGLKTGDERLLIRIEDGARTFNLKDIPFILRRKEGEKSALLLKEILDRVILIDLKKIPKDLKKEKSWRLKNTEIIIALEEKGEYRGEYLFSQSTRSRLNEFYNKVKHLPYLKGSGGGVGYREAWHERYIPKWVKEKFLGLEKWQWIGFLTALFFGFVLKFLSEFVVRRIKKFFERDQKRERKRSKRIKVLYALEKPLGFFLMSFFWFFCIHFLRFEGWMAKSLFTLVQVIFSVSLIWFLYRAVDLITDVMRRLVKSTDSGLDDVIVPLLDKSLRVLIVLIGGLFAVQNLGFNVMSLLAGLGLGGLALALAARDTAANLFGSIMIMIDRPFRIGDWIISEGVEGTVEKVGFRSTRVRTFYNSLVSIPNSLLANSNIDNMGERSYRRIKTVLSLTYDTPPEQMEQFIEGIKGVIQNDKHTRKDNVHVVFNEYGSYSLNILLYFFLITDDWGIELKAREGIFFKIYKLAEELNIQFAFPTQSLYMENLDFLAPSPEHLSSGNPSLDS